MKKYIFILILIGIAIIGCDASKNAVAPMNKSVSTNDTVRIANDSLEYEVTIIEPGFNSWLASVAKPRNFYSQSYLENKNLFWVAEWNRRALDPFQYNSNLYEMRIDYNSNINYGYEVNYLIYNYFVYFQQHYHQKL